jgi:predicted esterase
MIPLLCAAALALAVPPAAGSASLPAGSHDAAEAGAALSALLPELKRAALPEGAEIPAALPVAAAACRLNYEGVERELVLARSAGGEQEVSSLTCEFRRSHLVRPQGDGLAEAWIESVSTVTAAREAGRDRLEHYRDRPSGGTRVAVVMRRLGPSGAEPAAGDRSLRLQLMPFPELPRMPGRRLTAGRPVSRSVGGYAVTWSLDAAARLGDRPAWIVSCRVGPPPGGAPPRTIPLAGRAELLLDAGDFTVLAAVTRWQSLGAGGAVENEFLDQTRLVRREDVAAEEFAAELRRRAAARELLASLAGRDARHAAPLLEAARAAGCHGPELRAAGLFLTAERELTVAGAGPRRVALVPEDTAVHLWAPENPGPAKRLTPVIFLHGAGALAGTYFDDWSRAAAGRPLLLIFPQSKSWTWNLASDGAMMGSLLEVLGRTYDLDKERLVLAGHGAGAEMALALAYGADFPGYRVRGVAAAGAVLSGRLREEAVSRKPPELMDRLRTVDAFLLCGEKDTEVGAAAVRNLGAWLGTFNPKGIRIEVTPEVGPRYSTGWTKAIMDWATALPEAAEPAAPRAETGTAAPPSGNR